MLQKCVGGVVSVGALGSVVGGIQEMLMVLSVCVPLPAVVMYDYDCPPPLFLRRDELANF